PGVPTPPDDWRPSTQPSPESRGSDTRPRTLPVPRAIEPEHNGPNEGKDEGQDRQKTESHGPPCSPGEMVRDERHVLRTNGPSSATAATRRGDWNRSALPPFAV